MPREVHEHYDADGTLTGTTVVTRESPWDDDARDRVMRLAEYEALVCGCGCGLPATEAHDKDRPFKVDKFVCYAGRALERVRRQEADLAEKQNRPDGWSDGLHFYVTPFDDEEDA